jgi:hypothetical protein
LGRIEQGLHALRVFDADEVICPYWGNFYEDELGVGVSQNDRSDRRIALMECRQDNLFIDGSELCPATYINDAFHGAAPQVANCKYVENVLETA